MVQIRMKVFSCKNSNSSRTYDEFDVVDWGISMKTPKNWKTTLFKLWIHTKTSQMTSDSVLSNSTKFLVLKVVQRRVIGNWLDWCDIFRTLEPVKKLYFCVFYLFGVCKSYKMRDFAFFVCFQYLLNLAVQLLECFLLKNDFLGENPNFFQKSDFILWMTIIEAM